MSIQTLQLSQRSARPKIAAFNSQPGKFRLDAGLKRDIDACCRRFKVAPVHFYLAVFRILLLRYSNEDAEDICIGIADGNRKDAAVLRSLGLFLNLVPLRLRAQGQERAAA